MGAHEPGGAASRPPCEGRARPAAPNPRRGGLGSLVTARPSRREVWLWTLCVYVAGRLAINSGGVASAGDLLTHLTNHNLFHLLAYAALAVQLGRLPADRAAGRLDVSAMVAAFALGAVVAVLGIESADGLAATVLGAALLWSARRNTAGGDAEARPGDVQARRAAGAVFLALAFNLFWAKMLFVVLKAQIVLADTALVEGALRMSGYEVARAANALGVLDAQGVVEGHSIVVIGACSSFSNISLAVLACVCANVVVRSRFVRGDWWAIGAVGLVVLALNMLRLAAFAADYALYDYWHHGDGGPLLALAQTMVTLVAAFGVALHGSRARPLRTA